MQPHALVAATLQRAPGWGGSLLGLLPLVSRQLEEPEGRVETRAWTFGLNAHRTLMMSDSAQFALGIGYLLSVHRFEGSPNPGYLGIEQTLVTGSPVLTLQLDWSLSRDWQLATLGLLGASLPEVELRLAERSAAHWGRPWFGLGFGVSGGWLTP